MKLIQKLAKTEYVRSVIRDRADLSAFKKKPSVRIICGVGAIGFSYLIGWPAISALAALSVYWSKPLVLVIGGPFMYGLSHLVFLLGMYLAGAEYSKIFLRWATRITIETLTRKGVGSG
jgi:hypothetical protein